MSDYTDSMMTLADGARTPAKSHVGQSNNWLDAYGQQGSKNWSDYYDQYRKSFSGKQPEGYGAMMENQSSMSPGNSIYQWMMKSQQNAMDERMKEQQDWMEKYWAQQNQMQQGFQEAQQPQQDPALMEYLQRLEEQMAGMQPQEQQPTGPSAGDLSGFANTLEQNRQAVLSGQMTEEQMVRNLHAIAQQSGISAEQIASVAPWTNLGNINTDLQKYGLSNLTGATGATGSAPSQSYQTQPAASAPVYSSPAPAPATVRTSGYATPSAPAPAPAQTSGNAWTGFSSLNPNPPQQAYTPNEERRRFLGM